MSYAKQHEGNDASKQANGTGGAGDRTLVQKIRTGSAFLYPYARSLTRRCGRPGGGSFRGGSRACKICRALGERAAVVALASYSQQSDRYLPASENSSKRDPRSRS